MLLPEILSNIRVELQDTSGDVYSDEDLIRAVSKAVSLMSRHIPKKGMVETTVTKSISSETLTISSNTGTLAYKPIKTNSLSIPDKTLDTDYTVNYLTGVITEIGSNLPDTDYTVSYELDSQLLDISSLLSDYIRIERVEYPAGSNPATYPPFNVFDNFIALGGNSTLTEDKHLRIIYLGSWTPPRVATEQDYPSHLNDAVIIGSVGEALIFRAERLVSASYTLFEAANTTLDSITTPLADAVTALDAAKQELSDSLSILDGTELSTAFGDADTAFDNAVTELSSAISTLSGMTTPHSDASTALGNIAQYLGGGAAPSASKYLQDGDDLINAVTAGQNVGRNYASFAQRASELAAGYMREAEGNIRLANSYVSKSTREGAVGNSYINEGIQRLTVATRYLNKSSQQVTVANGYLSEANQRQALVGRYFEESTMQQNIATRYLEVASRCLASGQAKVNEFLTAIGVKAESQVLVSPTQSILQKG